MRTTAILPVLLLCLVVMLSLACRDQSARSGAAGGKSEPQAIVRAAADYLAALPAFSADVTLSINVQAETLDQQTEASLQVRLARPNRLAIVAGPDGAGSTLVSDGEQLTQFVPSFGVYTVSPAPPDLTKLSQRESELGLAMLGLPFSVIPADGEAFYKTLMTDVTSSQYLGTEMIDGAECHRCRFIRPDFDWEIWIEAGDRPLIRKVSADMSKAARQGRGTTSDIKVVYASTFTAWDLSPKFADADFAFTPPEGAKKVDSLTEAIAGGPGQEPHPLLGLAAPSFQLLDLQDRPVNLDTLLGENVVILDFWATWCEPCVEALPIITRVAAEFKDRGVVFYAINRGEDAALVNQFLADTKLSFPIAMDPEDKVARQYQVRFIPQTVIIGKDKKVQVVHEGFGFGFEEELRGELEQLLTGEDLAAKTLAEADARRVPENEEPRSSGGGER
jgi:peroxiredoxin